MQLMTQLWVGDGGAEEPWYLGEETKGEMIPVAGDNHRQVM